MPISLIPARHDGEAHALLKPDVSLDRKAAYPSAHIPIFPPEVQKLALTGVP
jgi:hypothetical protein